MQWFVVQVYQSGVASHAKSSAPPLIKLDIPSFVPRTAIRARKDSKSCGRNFVEELSCARVASSTLREKIASSICATAPNTLQLTKVPRGTSRNESGWLFVVSPGGPVCIRNLEL